MDLMKVFDHASFVCHLCSQLLFSGLILVLAAFVGMNSSVIRVNVMDQSNSQAVSQGRSCEAMEGLWKVRCWNLPSSIRLILVVTIFYA